MDILSVLKELEQDYSCRIETTFRAALVKGDRQLRVTVVAHPWLSISGGHRHSVSLSVTLDRPGCGMGVASIFRLLHTLAYEMGKAWQAENQEP